MRLQLRALVAGVLLYSSASTWGQINPNTQVGIEPYGEANLGTVDVVGVYNGSLTIRLPILTFPQRGSLKYGLRFVYDSKAWRVHEVCDLHNSHDDTVCRSNWSAPSSLGFLLSQETSHAAILPKVQDNNLEATLIDGDGGSHPAILVNRPGLSAFTSVDGSGLAGTYTVANGGVKPNFGTTPMWAVNSAGTTLSIPSGSPTQTLEDSNGNTITFEASTDGNLSFDKDTLGRTVSSYQSSTPSTSYFDPFCGSNAVSNIVSYPGPNGGQTQVKLCEASIAVSSSFGANDEYNNPIIEATGTVQAITSISIYDGNAWTTSPTWHFEYNDAYADLTKLTLPGGGSISYTWTTAAVPMAYKMELAGQAPVSRYVTSRTEDGGDGSPAQMTSYSPIGPVVNSLGDQTVTTGSYNSFAGTLETETVKQYDHVSGLLKTVATDFMLTSGVPYGIEGYINRLPIRVTTTWPNGDVSKVEMDYDKQLNQNGGNGYNGNNIQQFIGSYGKVIQRREYDFGFTSTSAPTRCTQITYKAFDNTAYLTANLLDLVSSETVYQGACSSTAWYSKTSYGYDEWGLYPSGVTTQLDTRIFTAAGTPRGNLTSVTRWINNNQGLTSKYQHYDTGMLEATSDPLSHGPTFSYSAQYQGAYLTSTQMPDTQSPNLAHHGTSATFDFNTGKVLSSTDENSNTTSYNLDLLGRVSSITYPADGGSSSIVYDPDNLTVHVSRAIAPGQFLQTDTLYDGLGRKSRSATISSSADYSRDQQDMCYDSVGRMSFASYLYQAAGFATAKVCSGPGDTFSYDALGRRTGTAHEDGSVSATFYVGGATDTKDEGNGASSSVERVTQVDGLGRMVSVCEVTSSAQLNDIPTSCAQDIGKTGFLTSYQYDSGNNLKWVQQGSLTRSFSYDALSRLTSATNPEAGTTTYTYYDDGALKSRTRPSPNQPSASVLTETDYAYDALQRQRTTSYTSLATHTSDPYTPAVTMQYDEMSLFGNSVSNASGKLTSATTLLASQNVSTGHYFLGFDTMGRLRQELECPPSACSLSNGFDLSYGYNYLGSRLSLTNSLFGTQLEYYDGAGHWSTTSHTLGGSSPMLSVQSYSQFGPTSVSLGNGLMQTDTFDDRGRMTDRSLGTPVPIQNQSPGQNAAGLVTIDGSAQTLVVVQSASGTVTISGREQKQAQSDCPSNNRNCYVYDTGSVSLTIAGTTVSYQYGQTDTVATITDHLVAQLPSTLGCSVTAGNNSVTFVAYTPGVEGNAISLGAQVSFDRGNFAHPSFTALATGSTLSGGRHDTTYDSGLISVSVNGYTNSVQFQQGSTAASVASALISGINGDPNSYVNASSDGTAFGIALTSRQVGAAGNNYNLSTSISYDNQDFSGASFELATSGSNLSGGVDQGNPHFYFVNNLYTFDVQYNPNGNLASSQDSANGDWTYGYDQLDRLATAASSSQGYQYNYDRYGNRLQQVLVSGTGYSRYDNNSGTSNRLDGLCYDAAGNVLDDTHACNGSSQHTYVYDAENRLVQVAGGPTYVYDAMGTRIAKQVSGQSGETDYLVNGGNQLAELSGGTLVHTNVYANGQLWATFSGSNADVTYHTNDWLGTRRIQTDVNGTLSLTCTNLPFGDAQSCAGSSHDATEQHFTGKERDIESGLDNFEARYYGSNMGRFMSPDYSDMTFGPDPVPNADITNPQSLNLYAYAQNNPLKNIDPDGHDCVNTSNYSANGTVTITTGSSCASDPGKYGTYVNGTVDQNSITASSKASGTTFVYNFTSYDGQSGGAGVITQAPAYGPLEGPANMAGAAMIGSGTKAIGAFAGASVVGGILGAGGLAVAGADLTITSIGAVSRFQAARAAWLALKGTGAAALIGQFFKTGAVPPGLTPEIMQTYLTMARAYVDSGSFPSGGVATQTARIAQLAAALGK